MAAAAPLPDFLEEATCSICLEYFQDPVLIPECGHNFCRGCLTRSWGTSESEASCPQCRQTFAPRNVLPNRQLARLVEVARRCGSPWSKDGESFCPKHREPLKLFCKDHETLICLVCDRSKEHRGHLVIPAEEAFQEYQDIGSILEKYQAKKTYENQVDLLPEPKWIILGYSDITELLKSAMEKLRVNVSLNPRTADPGLLVISKDQNSIKRVEPESLIYADPNRKRFVLNPYVLGCRRFSTGRHFWEVTVGDTAGWGVGVAKKPVKETYVDMQTSQWVFKKWGEKYMASSPSYSEFVLTEKPTKTHISLKCEVRQGL
ncbi:hypothetical protein Chor_011601 [Crotalus horridus]